MPPVSVLINGAPGGNTLIESQPLFHGGTFGLGKFPFVSVTGNMKEQQHLPSSNRLDRVEFNLERPAGDLEAMLELEQALQTA